MGVVRCGMASVIPLQLINILTAQDLDLRVCGLPDINLEYLKVRMCGHYHFVSCGCGKRQVLWCICLYGWWWFSQQRHTMYQVGLMETDRHVQFFWNALESFSQVS